MKGCTRRYRESAICASEFRPKHLAGTRAPNKRRVEGVEQSVDQFQPSAVADTLTMLTVVGAEAWWSTDGGKIERRNFGGDFVGSFA